MQAKYNVKESPASRRIFCGIYVNKFENFTYYRRLNPHICFRPLRLLVFSPFLSFFSFVDVLKAHAHCLTTV